MLKKIKKSSGGALFKDFILGGQDGLVNILGIVLGLAISTHSSRIVIIAGLSSTLAESISMGAVGFTSTRAELDYYNSKKKKNFVKSPTSPMKSAIVVLLSSIVGSIIPLIPVFFLPISSAMIVSPIITAIALFATGALEAEFTIGNWLKKGFQLMIIGMVAAFFGLLVGWMSNSF